jgi:hypothetical protein
MASTALSSPVAMVARLAAPAAAPAAAPVAAPVAVHLVALSDADELIN